MRIYEQKNILERNINYSNAYGRNLLQEAIVSCENTIAVDFVKLLVRYGADALSKNNAIRSPLDFAKQIEDTEMINILANKNLSSKYQSKKLI